MPRGFKENPKYPELPAILNYLREYDGQEFESTEAFQSQVLNGFLEYLNEQEVPKGSDPKLRKGLEAKELDDPFSPSSGDRWDYSVHTPATNYPGVCVFGGIEVLDAK